MTDFVKQLKEARLVLGDRPIRGVLLPTDMTAKSLRPLGIAVELAAAAGADLHLLHVHRPGIEGPHEREFPSDEEVRSSTWSSSPDSLRQWARPLIEKLVVHRHSVEAAVVSTTVVEFAKRHAIDLMVVGTAARSGLARAFLGSVAEQLIVHAECPVLTQAFDAPISIARPEPLVVAPIDFSRASLVSLAQAINFCEQLRGELALLHVVSPRPAPVVYGELPTVVWDVQEIQARVQAKLEALAETVPSHNKRRALVRVGTVTRTIIDVAEEIGADLIHVGSRGLSGLSRDLLGGVAQKVLRLSPVPVLVSKETDSDTDNVRAAS